MVFESGKLDRLITIQSVPEIEDEHGDPVPGEPIDEWPDVPAQFLELSGREFEQARQMSAETAGVVLIRYRPGITPRHQFVHEGVTHNLVFVHDPGKQHKVLRLHYKEVA